MSFYMISSLLFAVGIVLTASAVRDMAEKEEVTSFLLKEFQQMKTRIQILEQENEILKQKVNEAQWSQSMEVPSAVKNKRSITSARSVNVSFHASLEQKLMHLQDNQVLKMSTVEINDGGAYDGRSGIFTCKVGGVYVFHANLMIKPNTYLEADLILNGQPVLGIYAANDNHFGTGSNMVILRLQPSDEIWIRVHEQSHSDTDLSDWWSTFSGFLLYT